MSTIARRVADELRAYGDLPVTDHDVEEALAALHDRLDAGAGRRTRPRMLVAAAAVVAVIAAVAVAGLFLRSETTVPADDPLRTDGTLVIEFWSHPLWGHTGMVWAYRDGRVITSVQEDEHPYQISYVERLLSAHGLEILLDRVALLYHGATPSEDEFRHPCVDTRGVVRVSSGSCSEYVASVVEVNGKHYDVIDNRAMAQLLFEMESQLPDAAWRQRKPTPYVPTAYDACYGPADEHGQSIEMSLLLEGLPTEVRALLAAKPTARPKFHAGSVVSDQVCSRLTPSEAARVAGALGLRLGQSNEGHEYESLERQGASVIAWIYLGVVLPDGANGAYGG